MQDYQKSVKSQSICAENKLNSQMQYCCSNQSNGSGRVMWLEPQITGQILSRVGHQQAKERGRLKTRWVDDIRSLNNNWMSSAQGRKKRWDQREAFIPQWTNDGWWWWWFLRFVHLITWCNSDMMPSSTGHMTKQWHKGYRSPRDHGDAASEAERSWGYHGWHSAS